MTFCFYVRTHEEYKDFENFMEDGKKKFKDDWIFSSMETKPSYMRKYSAEFAAGDQERFVPPRRMQAKTQSSYEEFEALDLPKFSKNKTDEAVQRPSKQASRQSTAHGGSFFNIPNQTQH